MAAISITAANVLRVDGPTEQRLAGAAVTAGMVVRLDTSGNVIAAVNDSAANSLGIGIALNGGGTTQPILVGLWGCRITIGGTAEVGMVYVLGTAGGIIPVEDIATGEYMVFVGIGETAAILNTNRYSGVAAVGSVT